MSSQTLPPPEPFPFLLRVRHTLQRRLRILHNLLQSLRVLLELLLRLLRLAVPLQSTLVAKYSGHLGCADAEEQEVDGGEEEVAGLDDEAPAGPDQACGHKSGILREGELVGGAGEVGGAREDETPLCWRTTLALASHKPSQ